MTLFEQVFCTRVGFTAILILRLFLFCFLCCTCLEHKHFRDRAGRWLTFSIASHFKAPNASLLEAPVVLPPAALMFLLGISHHAYITISSFQLLSGTLEIRSRNVYHMTVVRRGSQLLLGREKTNN